MPISQYFWNNVKNRIEGLFPTPVFFSELKRNITKKELEEVEKQKKYVFINEGNISTNNTYILELPIFKKLKDELNHHIEEYVKQVIMPKNDVSLYITQSWLNYTEENQWHHRHSHPNSIVSGVFYFNANEELDKINFYNEKHFWFEVLPSEWTSFNAKSWWFPIKTGDVVLFPSSLSHSVEYKKGTNTRISLAFNTFIKGTLGREKRLTELKI